MTLGPAVQDYFERVLDVLFYQTPAKDVPYYAHVQQLQSSIGLLEARFEYELGFRLDIYLIADLHESGPEWKRYSFHFQDSQGRLVFRYDDAPHYPELRVFPHHKHVGPNNAVVESTQPTIHQIAREIADYLERQ